MKKLFLLVLLVICSGTITNAQTRGKEKVAVYVTGKMDDVYKKIISSKVTASLVRSNKYVALERADSFLDALMKEQDYQLSGEVGDSQIAKIGERYGARYIAIIDANRTYDGYCLMTARLVNVETGVIIKSVDGNRTIESTEDLVGLTNNVAYRLFIQ